MRLHGRCGRQPLHDYDDRLPDHAAGEEDRPVRNALLQGRTGRRTPVKAAFAQRSIHEHGCHRAALPGADKDGAGLSAGRRRDEGAQGAVGDRLGLAAACPPECPQSFSRNSHLQQYLDKKRRAALT